MSVKELDCPVCNDGHEIEIDYSKRGYRCDKCCADLELVSDSAMGSGMYWYLERAETSRAFREIEEEISSKIIAQNRLYGFYPGGIEDPKPLFTCHVSEAEKVKIEYEAGGKMYRETAGVSKQ